MRGKSSYLRFGLLLSAVASLISDFSFFLSSTFYFPFCHNYSGTGISCCLLICIYNYIYTYIVFVWHLCKRIYYSQKKIIVVQLLFLFCLYLHFFSFILDSILLHHFTSSYSLLSVEVFSFSVYLCPCVCLFLYTLMENNLYICQFNLYNPNKIKKQQYDNN